MFVSSPIRASFTAMLFWPLLACSGRDGVLHDQGPLDEGARVVPTSGREDEEAELMKALAGMEVQAGPPDAPPNSPMAVDEECVDGFDVADPDESPSSRSETPTAVANREGGDTVLAVAGHQGERAGSRAAGRVEKKRAAKGSVRASGGRSLTTARDQARFEAALKRALENREAWEFRPIERSRRGMPLDDTREM